MGLGPEEAPYSIGRTQKSYQCSYSLSPDGSPCASAGRDGEVLVWDLNEATHLYSLEAGADVHALTFSPNRYWLCAAVGSYIKVWDLERKTLLITLGVPKKEVVLRCLSLAWSAYSDMLYAGYSDNIIRVWQVDQKF